MEEAKRTRCRLAGGSSSSEFLVTTCLNLKALERVVEGELVGAAKKSSLLPSVYERNDLEVSIPTKLSGSFISAKFSLLS
jgi:hypothetical protein